MNSVEDHLQSLGQKYMGASRPKNAADYAFATNVPSVEGGHPVPVSNFMNAQCKCH
jgi:saccharopepsin